MGRPVRHRPRAVQCAHGRTARTLGRHEGLTHSDPTPAPRAAGAVHSACPLHLTSGFAGATVPAPDTPTPEEAPMETRTREHVSAVAALVARWGVPARVATVEGRYM
ncbi:hypothetical protein CUD01_22200 [Cellulomonas uda]|uniref:Uncharacterized protein n=1 Tax=Cellulomonas uda TaxID=1714 RepID=A0A4Y3KDP9_CELUD|nr:hypothetical protein CUD01_22200 [Cellulomonas uda]